MGILKKVTVLLMFLTFSIIGKGATNDKLTITKDINFEVEIGTAIDTDLEDVVINFGDIVRGNDNTITKVEYLKFKTAFSQDNMISTSFPKGDLTETDKDYGKFKLEHKDNSSTGNDNATLPVYLRKMENFLIKRGEIQIPIRAEIRGVPKDQKLGEYYKAIEMNVTTTPINPIDSLKKYEGGVK